MLFSVPLNLRRERLERRIRERARHPDGALSYTGAGPQFPDVHAVRLEFDDAE